jgi:stage V sporulation protein K
LNQNLENIILIDEAYSMARGGNKDYGSDAITAIVDWMDKNLGCYMLIIAGYEKDINDDFLAVNEGLDRRFNNKVVFLEYTGAQMADILKKILSKSGSDKKWDNDTWTRVATLIEKANASCLANRLGLSR